MPLPQPGKTEWPPKTLEKAYRAYEVNSAWYAGDPDVLASVYGGGTGFDPTDVRYRAAQFRGGVVGRVARWFWGSPPPAGELRTKLHVPAATDVARMSANLLFSEQPKITVDDKATQDRLEVLIDEGDLHPRLLEGAEVCAPLGDVYAVVTWDTALRDVPWIRFVHGDAVVPEFTGDVLSAATIWAVVHQEDSGHVWRHLERHEAGKIYHGLYRGDSKTLGVLAELKDHPTTERLTADVTTGVDRLLIEHIPNVRPNRQDRASLLGASDYSPAILGLMDQLDEVWSSCAREFRLAKARAVVTADSPAMQPQGPGRGAVADIDREIFVPLAIPPSERPSSPVQLVQPLIRVEEHLAGARALTEAIYRGCGYSASSFGDTATVAVTATEARSRERLSFVTRDSKALHWRRLRRVVETLLMVDAVVFRSKVKPDRPTIEFGDSITDSPDSIAQTLNLLLQAEAASIETRVRWLHPEWDDTEVTEEVERIKAEKGTSVPDPTMVLDPMGDDEETPVKDVEDVEDVQEPAAPNRAGK